MHRSVSLFGFLLFQIVAMACIATANAAPTVYGGTYWGQASFVDVTNGTDSVSYIDQGELGLPGIHGFGASVATWTDGVTTLLVVGAPNDDDSRGAVYLFRRTQETMPWHQEARLQASDGKSSDEFGTAVAMTADLIVVGAPQHDNGSSSGAVYTFTRDTTTGKWQQETSPLAIGGAKLFGGSLAFSDVWLIVGAPHTAGNNGIAQMYRRDGSSWTMRDTLAPPDSPSRAEFGCSVALNGNRVLIGASYDSTNASWQGSAYLLNYDSGTSSWQFEKKLVDAGGKSDDQFGSSVALVGDSAIVGAPGAGRVLGFRYIRPTRDWAQQPGLQGAPNEWFGSSLAYDGSLLAVGATDHGGIYLFSGTAASWMPMAKLDAGGDPYASLGSSVSIAGNDVFGGASNALWGSERYGSVDIYATSSGTWNKTQSIHASSDEGELFGEVLAISGNTAVVAAPRSGSTGAAVVYSRDDGGHWKLEATLPINGYSSSTNVAIDGDTLIIGVPDETFGSHVYQGAAYVYVRSHTPTDLTWTQQAFLVDLAGHDGDGMGTFVSLSGDTALVGAPWLNGEVGGAYIFVRSGTSWTQQALLTVSEKTNAGVGYAGAINRDTVILGLFDGDGAYVFQRAGSTWTEKKKISGSDTAETDDFGRAIALSNDRAFVGASRAAPAGRVYIFDTRSWMQQATIDAPDATTGSAFGQAIAAEANRLIVGTRQNSAYAYSRQKGLWTLQAKFVDDANSSLGYSVGVSKGMLILGAPYAGQHGGGRAYLFQDDRIFEDELE
jgi:hypothetical protein